MTEPEGIRAYDLRAVSPLFPAYTPLQAPLTGSRGTAYAEKDRAAQAALGAALKRWQAMAEFAEDAVHSASPENAEMLARGAQVLINDHKPELDACFTLVCAQCEADATGYEVDETTWPCSVFSVFEGVKDGF